MLNQHRFLGQVWLRSCCYTGIILFFLAGNSPKSMNTDKKMTSRKRKPNFTARNVRQLFWEIIWRGDYFLNDTLAKLNENSAKMRQKNTHRMRFLYFIFRMEPKIKETNHFIHARFSSTHYMFFFVWKFVCFKKQIMCIYLFILCFATETLQMCCNFLWPWNKN